MRKNDLNGWRYKANLVNGVFDFKVIPLNPISPPKIFYKFYSLSENAVDALTNLYIYASHPFQLNDPFDCSKDIIQINDSKSMQALWGKLYDKFCQDYQSDNAIIEVSNDAFSTIIFRKWGVFCLTPNKDNEIMWSLYAQNTGFRLGFDVSKFLFATKGPFPINYCKTLPHIKTSKYDVHTAALIQTNVKHDSWSYEDEWRLLVLSPDGFDMETFGPLANDINRPDDHDRKYRYPLSALKSITLGCDFFKEAQLEHRLFCVGDSEMDVVYHEECLQTQVLDFLNEVQTKYSPLRVCLASIDKEKNIFEDIPVKIIKLSKYTYHFIEIG